MTRRAAPFLACRSRIFHVERQELIVGKHERNVRLEDFLFDRFPNLSRMYLREIVRDEKCQVNGRFENIGHRLRADDFVEIELDPSRETAMLPEAIPLDIVFEDAHLVVVNKPAGMLVHPTHRDKRGTLLNALSFHLNARTDRRKDDFVSSVPSAYSVVRDVSVRGTTEYAERTESTEKTKSPENTEGSEPTNFAFQIPHSALPKSEIRNPKSQILRPGLVHRLDKQTSGLIVIAKSVAIHRKLARQFQKKLVEKKYLALVEGIVRDDEGTIEGTIGRYADEKRWDLKEDGKHSTSRFRVIDRFDDTTLLELEPVTGRTNQLRIHCASLGHPIVGDVSRGGRVHQRLCLHAFRLAFRHPITGIEHRFEREVEF